MESGAIMRKVIFIRVLLLATVVSATLPAAADTKAGRYLAVFADGRRITGDAISGWHAHPGSAHIAGVAMSDPKRPLLWMRDRSLKRWRAGYNCPGYVEFIGGDRIAGRVIGARPGGLTDGRYTQTHVLVKPVENFFPPLYKRPPYIAVLPRRIQRIVWGDPSKRPLNPGNLYRTDGRTLRFQHVRWGEESVKLLLSKGSCDVKLSDIAEIHMPRVDQWGAYYRELAVLSPSLDARLVRYETIGGLIATASENRIRALPFKNVTRERQCWTSLLHYDHQIEQSQANLAKMVKTIDLTRKTHAAKTIELQKAQAADRQTYNKSLAALRQRMEQQRKTEEAKLAQRLAKHEEQLRKSEADLARRLAKTPPAQRDKQIRDLRARNARSRDSNRKQLESERARQHQHRTRQIDSFSRSEPQRLANARRAMVAEVTKLKQQLDSHIANHGNHVNHLKAIRLQRAAIPDPQRGAPSTWTHVIHPVWSVDPLWARFSSVRMIWSFAPDSIPLSRVRPSTVVIPAMQSWRADRNASGGPLRSGRLQYGWGFGLHAPSELSFALPPQARSFRCRMGLDYSVDTGGCARARIFVGSTRDKPRYQSPLMIGSQKTADSGSVSLATGPDSPRRLILQVDPAARDHPAGADPLNIRDKFDWLDPQITFDRNALGAEVRKQIADQIAAWRGWTVKLDKPANCAWTNRFDDTIGICGRFITAVQPENQPLVVSKTILVGPNDKWIVVDGGYVGGGDIHIGSVTLHVGAQAIPAEKLPVKYPWMRRGPPLVFPIAGYNGKKISFELKRGAGRPIYWRRIDVTGRLPVSYRLAGALEKFGKKEIKITPGLAGILASDRTSKQVKETVLEIHRLGGEVNYRGQATLWFGIDSSAESDGGTIVNALIGDDWKGGDNGLALLKKLPGLQYMAMTRNAGVSKQAHAKLRTEMAHVRLYSCHRSPSAAYSPRCWFTVRNSSGKEVHLFLLSTRGGLQGFTRLKPGHQIKRTSGIGARYEAHLITKDYNKSKPISQFTATPNSAWDIKAK
jgi:hypothetical protein